jgi:hypothetical protein
MDMTDHAGIGIILEVIVDFVSDEARSDDKQKNE